MREKILDCGASVAQAADEIADGGDALLIDEAQGRGADDGDIHLAAQEIHIRAVLHAEAEGEGQLGRGSTAGQVAVDVG
jgi:hypothetical protein